MAHELVQPGNTTTMHDTSWRQSQTIKTNGNEPKEIGPEMSRTQREV